MSPSFKLELDSGELCAIIATCAESRVRLLKLTDLEIYFEDPLLIDQQIRFRKQSASEDPGEARKLEQKRIEKEELAVRTDQLQNMVVSDPEQFEELLTEEELDGRGEEKAE